MRGWIAALVVLCGCPGDEPPTADDGSTGAASTSTGTISTSTSGTAATTMDTDASSSGGASSSSTGGPGSSSTTGLACTPSDACQVAADCPLPEAECIDCACMGGVGCVRYGPGTFGACLVDGMADTTVCEADGAQCLPDDGSAPMAATCIFPGCTEVCDCPQPPEGFEAQLACGDVANNGGGVLECYVSCERGDPCPRGWVCVDELFCAAPPGDTTGTTGDTTGTSSSTG